MQQQQQQLQKQHKPWDVIYDAIYKRTDWPRHRTQGDPVFTFLLQLDSTSSGPPHFVYPGPWLSYNVSYQNDALLS